MLTTAAWSCCFALIGLALHYLSNYRASLRYLADASYWIYLLHLPLVIALQAWVTKTEWHWLLKLTWVLGATMIISLLTYHFLVRFTWIGAALNGKRRSRKKAHLAMPNKMETSV